MQTPILPAGSLSHACSIRHRAALAGSFTLAALLAGCVSSGVPNAGGVAPVAVDPSVPGPVSGVGIEGHDIVSMTDQMMRDMLTEAALAGRPVAPRVVIDSSNFKNTGSQAINRDLITNRLRVNLNRAAKGRMIFITRTDLSMVQQERDLKDNGVVDAGTNFLQKPYSLNDLARKIRRILDAGGPSTPG